MLKHLRRQDLDEDRWNATVAADPTALPYGFTWWLDAATNGQWQAFVIDDYRLVLPLPCRSFFGRFTQVQRAPFTQQSGPFGDLQKGDLTALTAALSRFRSAQLPLSERFTRAQLPSQLNFRPRTNLVLNLSPAYADIKGAYHRALKRKLRKYNSVQLSSSEPELIIDLYRESVGSKAGLKPRHYRRIRSLMEAALRHQAGLLIRADDPEEGLLAAGFFPFYRDRLINQFVASSPIGYQFEGMARLLDALVQAYRGPGRVLDFEGSDIPGVATFFRSFGPEEREYLMLE